MAVGNELGYLAALFSRFYVMLAFTMIKACDRFCANAKNISIFSILLLLLTAVALFYVQNKLALPKEESSVREDEDDRWALVKCFREMFWTMKRLNNMLGNAGFFWTQNTTTAVNNGRRSIEKIDMLFIFAQNLSHAFVTSDLWLVFAGKIMPEVSTAGIDHVDQNLQHP
ncbi:Sucrose transport protein [Arachis hypogaea]|nr:Sucrose transport protein [Arachis hypogaea]